MVKSMGTQRQGKVKQVKDTSGASRAYIRTKLLAEGLLAGGYKVLLRVLCFPVHKVLEGLRCGTDNEWELGEWGN